MGNDAVHDLTAAYALDALDADEARGYEAHLASCERCRDELASLQATAASLAYAAPAAAPPAALRGRILDAARAERPNNLRFLGTRHRRNARVFAAVAAVAACAAVGLGVWNITLHNRLGRAPQALRGVPLTGAKGSVVVAGGRGALVFADLAPAPPGKTYEAWVVTNGQARSAGTFAGGRTIVVSLSRPVPKGAVVAVTVERSGGVAQPTQTPKITSRPI